MIRQNEAVRADTANAIPGLRRDHSQLVRAPTPHAGGLRERLVTRIPVHNRSRPDRFGV
jgi:hypothetical protein